MRSQTTATTLRGDGENQVSYFGLKVNVIVRMESYSLIAYGDRECIVNSSDLEAWQAAKAA